VKIEIGKFEKREGFGIRSYPQKIETLILGNLKSLKPEILNS
jgi:hypothetical protein